MFVTWYRTEDKIDKVQKKTIYTVDDEKSNGYLTYKKQEKIARLKSSLDTINNKLKSKWNEIKILLSKT